MTKAIRKKTIDMETVVLEGIISAENRPTKVEESDGDGFPDLMVKFDRQTLIEYLDGTTGEVRLTVTGEIDGMQFEGSDKIRVIGKDKSKRKDKSKGKSKSKKMK